MKLRKILFSEAAFFTLILILNTIPVLSFKYFLTIDGPTHLYNANLIKDLVLGNSPLISSLYKFNPLIPPNWIGHFILATLSLVFNGDLTEKIFILLFLIFLPVSFRYLVNSISTSQRNLSYLIFPFTYTYLFEAGFFNFCISFIFMFFSLGYWYKNEGKFHIRQVFIFSLLLTLTFFSHILVFGVLEMLIALIIIGHSFKNNPPRKILFLNLLKKSSVLFLASLPGLLFMINFLVKIRMPSSHEHFSSHELLMWVANVKPLVLFNLSVESKITHYFTFIYLAILLYSVFLRFKKIKGNQPGKDSFLSGLKDELCVTDLFLLISFFILILFFLIPDGTSAGMMSERLCLFFFILLIIWLAIQTLPKWFYILMVVATLGVNIFLMIEHFPSYKDLANYANEINKAARNIRKESIVYTMNWTDHWMLGHVTDYFGVEKPVIFLNNYEAEAKWFPLVYKESNFPKSLFGDEQHLNNVWWYSKPESGSNRKINYIFIFGYTGRLDDPQFQELKDVVMKYYTLVYVSSNHVYKLYALKPIK